MGLDTYRKKRNFAKTPEPDGIPATSDPNHLRFIVQRHAARALHYDFRLEHNGVLLSWSVPKGPSLSPKDKRLAVRTEDHPLSYGSFEGVIPKGEYGGGTVQLWETGYWQPQGDVDAGLTNGRLSFTLHGQRLSGAYTLVRMPGEKPEPWLLMKSTDEHADTAQPPVVDRYPDSVLTRRSLAQIAADETAAAPAGKTRRKPAVKAATGPAPTQRQLLSLPGARKGQVPWPLSPQLPTLVDQPAQGAQWLHELKLDGYRLLVRLQQGQISLFTRSGQDWTQRLEDMVPLLQAAFGPLQDGIIDGELVAFDSQGRSAFNKLQTALRSSQRRLYVMAFDLLQAEGVDLRKVPLLQRKQQLEKLIRTDQDRVRYSDHIIDQGPEVLNQACRLATEGVVSKKVDAPYREGRSRDWLKVKCSGREEFVVGAYVTREGRSLTSLLLGRPDSTGLTYVGRVGTGFTADDSRELLSRCKSLTAEVSPFTREQLPTYAGDRLHYLQPKLLVEVKFANWTDQGILRHAVYLGLREDKPVPAPLPQADLSNIRISHPGKVLYPETGLTKGTLAAWTAMMAPWILPHIVNRPLMLLRCPAGRSGQCFYQKHYENLPPAVKPRTLTADEPAAITIEDAEGLLSLIQMGTLEIHPWGARADQPDNPDRIVFDLDPDPALPFATLTKAALEVRDYLAGLGLQSWLRWSGGKGFHLVVPIAPVHSWPQVKAFSKAVAQALVRQNPNRYVATATLAKRKQKIFIDWLRNGRGATAIASWGVRARDGATVAVPLRWSQLAADMNLTAYRVPLLQPPPTDPWAGFFQCRQSIPQALLAKLNKD